MVKPLPSAWQQLRSMSCKLGFCKNSDAERIIALLQHIGLPTALPCFSAAAYIEAILKDKKKIGGCFKNGFHERNRYCFYTNYSSSGAA